MTERVGIYGGMFDPIHEGHVAVARHGLELLRLDRLLLIPCGIPNHRRPALAAPRHRLAMLELAARFDPRIAVDSIEIDSAGEAWTARTLSRLRDRFPQAALVLLLGLDAFLELPRWREPRRLFDLAHILVIARGKLPMDKNMAGGFGGSMTTDPESMFQQDRGLVLFSDGPRSEVSSSAARAQLAQGLAAPLPAAVLAYARKHGLYRAAEG